jgi:hypothetical protein
MGTKRQTADRHDPATQKARAQFDAKMPKSRFQNRSSPFFKAPDLSSDRPFLVQNCNFTRFRGSGLVFRSAIFDATIGVRSSSVLPNRSYLTSKWEFGAHLFLSYRPFLTQNCDFGAYLLVSNRPLLTQTYEFGAHLLCSTPPFLMQSCDFGAHLKKKV